MPQNYEQTLSSKELEDLVEYLLEEHLRRREAPKAEPGGRAAAAMMDDRCGNALKTASRSPHGATPR